MPAALALPHGRLVSTLWARVDAGLDKTGECWLWTRSTTADGYGRVKGDGKQGPVLLVHRVQYERYVGPIPDGMHVDHLCRVTGCARPLHLEVVSPRTNALRGQAPTVTLHLDERCARGHPAAESYRRLSTGRVVYCRTCRREQRAAA